MVSGSISLPCSGFFSPFPHGTGSLSVFRYCLALADGPAVFAQDSSCPGLLWIPDRSERLRVRDCHPSGRRFPSPVPLASPQIIPVRNPAAAVTATVWAGPRSIASTKGITCCFLFLRLLRCFSSPGLPRIAVLRWPAVGCPIQKSPDQSLFATPRSLSQLITSFIAS